MTATTKLSSIQTRTHTRTHLLLWRKRAEQLRSQQVALQKLAMKVQLTTMMVPSAPKHAEWHDSVGEESSMIFTDGLRPTSQGYDV